MQRIINNTDIPVVRSLNIISENFGEEFVNVALEWSSRDSSQNDHEFSVMTSSESVNDSQYSFTTNRLSDKFNITYNIEHTIFVSGVNCVGKTSVVNKTFSYGKENDHEYSTKTE